jgi:histidine triad (HIT) family protein
MAFLSEGGPPTLNATFPNWYDGAACRHAGREGKSLMPEERPDCIFCQIVAGKAPAHVVLEDELSLCLLDINPFTEGHCLVISKRHVPWWHDLSEEETVSLFTLARRAALKLQAAFAPEFVCLYARGRRVPHTHIFLVPTVKGDVLDGFFNALEKFQESPRQLAALKEGDNLARAAEKIRRASEHKG